MPRAVQAWPARCVARLPAALRRASCHRLTARGETGRRACVGWIFDRRSMADRHICRRFFGPTLWFAIPWVSKARDADNFMALHPMGTQPLARQRAARRDFDGAPYDGHPF